MPSNERGFPQWPAEVRSAVIVKDYAQLTFTEQYLQEAQEYLQNLSKKYPSIIKSFEESGGHMEHGVHDDGSPDLQEFVFSLGSTIIVIDCNEKMVPKRAAHYFDLTADPVTGPAESEAAKICEAMTAYCYSESTDRAAFSVELGIRYLRNKHTVNGIQDLTERAKQDPILINNAIAGANIERVSRSGSE